MSGRRRLAILALVALALLAEGCSSVPTTSEVKRGREVRFEQEEPFVRALAQDPRPGDDPLAIVQGFLSASASVDTQVARKFLAPEARGWQPFNKITVYDDTQRVEISAVPSDQVALRAPVRAVIDAEGSYQAAAPGIELRVDFKLRQDEGEWRISNTPDGLLVSPTDLDRAFRSVNLYFTDPSLSTLVPDPVVLPIRDRFETTLVDRLLDGPTSRLRGSVGSGFATSDNRLGPVVIENGVATVNLGEAAGAASEAQRRAMAAQLVATLRQLPDVSDIGVQVAGSNLRLPGVTQPMPRDAWPTFDPDLVGDDVIAAFRDEARIGSLADGGRVGSVPAGSPGALPVRFPALGMAGDNRVAGLDASRTNLLVGPLAADQQLTSRLTAPDLTPPSWDGTGAVWVASGPGGGPSSAWVVRDGQQPLAVELPPEISAGSIRALRVARDGTRVAIVVAAETLSRLFLGRIERTAAANSAVAVRDMYEVDPALTHVIDVSWQDSTSLAVLVSDGSGLRQVSVVTVDGSRALPVPGLPDAVSIAAAPGDRLVAATADGRLFQYSGASWLFVTRGAEPSYPG